MEGRINTLAKIGVTGEESRRLQLLSPEHRERELSQQIESLTQEILEDNPVSTPYSYWFDKQGQLYTHPSLEEIYNLERQFDPQERGGKPLEGFRDGVIPRLLTNPNKLVFWYSPSGKASFDNNPQNPYSAINYNVGQLYVQYFDGIKVNGVAIKVSNEKAIQQFMPDVFRLAHFCKDNQERITRFLTNPAVSDHTIDTFLNYDWKNYIVYKDKNGQEHTIIDIKSGIVDALLGKKKTRFNLPSDIKELLRGKQITEKLVIDAYLKVIVGYMEERGYKEMALGGSCGGSLAEVSSLRQMLGMSDLEVKELVSPQSSVARLLAQSTPWETEFHESYECPQCKNKISGEHKTKTSSWTPTCVCGYVFGNECKKAA